MIYFRLFIDVESSLAEKVEVSLEKFQKMSQTEWKLLRLRFYGADKSIEP
jgi:hypothetical protein